MNKPHEDATDEQYIVTEAFTIAIYTTYTGQINPDEGLYRFPNGYIFYKANDDYFDGTYFDQDGNTHQLDEEFIRKVV